MKLLILAICTALLCPLAAADGLFTSADQRRRLAALHQPKSRAEPLPMLRLTSHRTADGERHVLIRQRLRPAVCVVKNDATAVKVLRCGQ